MGSRRVLLWKMILAAAALNARKACAQPADARVREIGKQALSGPIRRNGSLTGGSQLSARGALGRAPASRLHRRLCSRGANPFRNQSRDCTRSAKGRDVLRTYGRAPFHIRECASWHAREDPRLHGGAARASVVEGK